MCLLKDVQCQSRQGLLRTSSSFLSDGSWGPRGGDHLNRFSQEPRRQGCSALRSTHRFTAEAFPLPLFPLRAKMISQSLGGQQIKWIKC